MGNEVSRLDGEEPLERSRSLSPLPRGDDPFGYESGDDHIPPSTMPARMSSAWSPPPEQLRLPRNRRSPSYNPSPDSPSPFPDDDGDDEHLKASSQPAQRARRSSVSDKFAVSASQPEQANSKKARSSKRRSTGTKKLKKGDAQDEQSAGADEETTLYESPRSKKKKSKRRSIQQDEPEPGVTGDLESQHDASPEQARRRKKDKRKEKEAITDEAERSIFDFDDEPPPSAQPLRKRSRRDSDSKLRSKKRKATLSHDEEEDDQVKQERSDDAAGVITQAFSPHLVSSGVSSGMTPAQDYNDLNSPPLPGSNIKVEREEEDDPFTMTQSNGSAPFRAAIAAAAAASRASQQPDSGYAESDDQVRARSIGGPGLEEEEEEEEEERSDGLPRFPSSGEDSQNNDDNNSVRPEPQEDHMESDDWPPSAEEDPEEPDAADPTDDEGEQEQTTPTSPARRYSVTETADKGSDGDETASDSETNNPEDAGDRGTPNKSQGSAKDQQAHPENEEPVATPPASSVASQGPRHSNKRKVKKPFSISEDKENAEAFAELPQDDVAAQPRPTWPQRTKAARAVVEPEASASNANQAPKNKRTKKPKAQAPAVANAAADHDQSDAETATGKQYKTGVLSQDEQSRITRAIKRFRENEDLTQEEVNRIIHENPQKSGQAVHRQIWATIQEACPSRPRQKLINWCRQHFHNFAGRGVWSPEQDDELAELVELHGKKWSYIAGLINRHQKDVRDRWRNYVICRKHLKTDVWSEEEEERFRDIVEAAIEKIREGLEENSNKSPGDLINWLTISEAMGHTRSRLQCAEKWKRMRAAEPLADKVPTVLPPGSSWRLEKARTEIRQMTAQDKYDLMCAVRDQGVGTDAKIRWKPILTRTFGGRYERQALVVVWGRLRKAVPEWEWKTTRDCARYLCEMYEREGNFRSAGFKEAEEDGQEGLEEAPESSQATRKKGKTAKKSRSRAVSESQDDAAPVEDNKPADGKKHRTSSKKRACSEESEEIPEPAADSSHLSPTVEAQAARRKRREHRERSLSAMSSPKGKEKETQPPTSNGSPKLPKRARRASLADDEAESHKTKKRKTAKTYSSTKGRANGTAAKGVTGGGNGKFKSAEMAFSSDISSDMDDMEDIPATLPTSSRAD